MKRSRLPVAVRRDAILNAAIAEAVALGLGKIRREGVAIRAGVSNGLISHHFNTLTQLRRAVIREAIQRKELKIIAEAILDKDPLTHKLDPELKAQAAAFIMAEY